MNKCHVLWYCVTYSVVNMAYESFIQMLCILFMCFVCSVFYFFILFAYLLYLQNCLFALHITNYGEIFAYLHVQFYKVG